MINRKYLHMKKLILVSLLGLLAHGTSAQMKSFLDVPYVEVFGSADTLVTPNEIYISIVIAEADVKNRISLEEQERKMVAGLKSLGINTEKELSTSDMQSNFRYYVLKQKDVMKTKSYTLKVGDAVLATRVFMKLEELGIANANLERVGHSEMLKLKNSCRTNAVKNAHAKALALTSPIGAAVGAPLHIADFSNDGDGATQPASQIRVRGMSTLNEVKEELPQIDFEKIRISMNVNVKFMLK
jgi:uncharacterized protein YggE